MVSRATAATPDRRGWAVSVLTAAAIVAAVLGVAFGLQAAILPRPAHGAVVATQAMAWVSGKQPMASTVTTAGAGTTRSTCVRHDLRFPDGNVEAAARLTAQGTTRVIPVGYPFRTAAGVRVGKPRGLQLARLALAGCPPVLESLLGGLMKYRSSPPTVGRATVAGRAALTLTTWTKGGRVTVYLAADSKQPLAVSVDGPRLQARARLRLLERKTATAGGP